MPFSDNWNDVYPRGEFQQEGPGGTYQPVPRPGENRAAVTDDYLRAAVAAVRTAQQP